MYVLLEIGSFLRCSRRFVTPRFLSNSANSQSYSGSKMKRLNNNITNQSVISHIPSNRPPYEQPRLRRFLPLKLIWIAFPYKRFSEHQHAKREFGQTSAAVRYTVLGVPGSYRRHPGGRLQWSLTLKAVSIIHDPFANYYIIIGRFLIWFFFENFQNK